VLFRSYYRAARACLLLRVRGREYRYSPTDRPQAWQVFHSLSLAYIFIVKRGLIVRSAVSHWRCAALRTVSRMTQRLDLCGVKLQLDLGDVDLRCRQDKLEV